MSTNLNTKGVIAIFDDPEAVIAAAHKCRKHGWRKFDVYAPFPVHGLSDAIGIPRSKIPWITFIAGLAGGSFGFLLQAWTSAVAWPINIGGKPFISWPAFIPVTFELTILIAGLSTAAALFVTCNLPKLNELPMALSLTDDKFGLFVPATEVGFNKDAVTQFLKEANANDVRDVQD